MTKEKKPRKTTGYNGMSKYIFDQFKQCDSYPQWIMQMAFRGIDLGNPEIRKSCRNRFCRKAEEIIDYCFTEQEPDRKYNLKKIEMLKDFWRNHNGIMKDDWTGAEEFLIQTSRAYDGIYDYDYSRSNFEAWKDVICFFAKESQEVRKNENTENSGELAC